MKIVKGYLVKVVEERDKTVAIAGLAFFTIMAIYVMVAFGKPIQLIVPILGFLACSSYLLIRGRLSAMPSLDQIKANPRIYVVLNIAFFLLLIYSILSIYLSPELYTRPLGYFISIALMSAVLAVEILLFADHRSCLYLALFKIVLIALSLVFSQLLIFPSIVGGDPWNHEVFTLWMLDGGHIQAGHSYSKLPMTHLLAGATMLITDLNYKIAAAFSISMLQVICDTLFIFLLGRFMFNTKVGLLAVLFLGVAACHVRFGIWGIPTTLGAMLIVPIIYLLLKTRKERPNLAFSLSLILMMVVIMTHSIVAMCLAILLLVLWAGFEGYSRLSREQRPVSVTINIAAMYIIAMFGYWFYVSGHFYALVAMIRNSFSREVALYGEVGQYISIVPFWEKLFNNSGLVLFFALALIGCLYMISKRFGNSYTFTAALSGVVILALAYVPPLIGLSIIGGRWGYFATIMLAIPAGLALFLLVGVFRNMVAKAGLVAIGVLILAFLMIMSNGSNLDNRTFSPNTLVRVAFTESELQAFNTIQNIWDGEIGFDNYGYQLSLLSLSPVTLTNDDKRIDEQLNSRDFSDSQNSLIFIRDEIVSNPFQLLGCISRLDYDPREVLSEQGFSKVYDCGSVAGFIYLGDGQH